MHEYAHACIQSPDGVSFKKVFTHSLINQIYLSRIILLCLFIIFSNFFQFGETTKLGELHSEEYPSD